MLVRQKEEAERRAKEQTAYEQLQREKEKADRLARENAEKKESASKPEIPLWQRQGVRAGIALTAIAALAITGWLVHRRNMSIATSKNPETHYTQGELLRSQKNFGEAIEEYREAIGLKPDYAAAHFGLGIALRDNGNLDDAAAEFREVIREHPADAGAHDALGLTLFRKGDFDGATKEYQEATRLNPSNAEAHYLLANALEKTGDHDAAIREYREVIRLQPDFANSHAMPDLTVPEKNAPRLASSNPPVAPTPKKPAVDTTAPARVTQGGNVQAAKLLKRPPAVYPQEAIQARISGRVRVHAVIAKDGTVREVYVMSGPSLLVKSAMDAVKQSLYTPTLLDGHPVEVDTTIDMVYKLPPAAAPAAPPDATGPSLSSGTENPKPSLPSAAKATCTFGKIDFTEEGNKLTGMVPYTYQGSYPLDAVALRGIPLKKDNQQISGLTYAQSTLPTATGKIGFSIEGHPSLGKKGEASDILVIAIFVKQTGAIVCGEKVLYQRQW